MKPGHSKTFAFSQFLDDTQVNKLNVSIFSVQEINFNCFHFKIIYFYFTFFMTELIIKFLINSQTNCISYINPSLGYPGVM